MSEVFKGLRGEEGGGGGRGTRNYNLTYNVTSTEKVGDGWQVVKRFRATGVCVCVGRGVTREGRGYRRLQIDIQCRAM